MLMTRLKEMDLRITELSDYLQVSRPTVYKFIDYYDSCKFDLINNKVLKLFNYIMENELAGKKNVVNYILTNLVELKEMGDDAEQNKIKNVKKFIINNPEAKKSKFFEICIKTNEYDELIYLLVDTYPILKKKKLSPEETIILNKYKEIKSLLSNNTKESK